MSNYQKRNSKASESSILIADLPKNKRERIRIQLRSWNGFDFCDCRVFATLEDGKVIPTPKGVAISLRQLPQLIEALRSAELKAHELGLINEEEDELAAA